MSVVERVFEYSGISAKVTYVTEIASLSLSVHVGALRCKLVDLGM